MATMIYEGDIARDQWRQRKRRKFARLKKAPRPKKKEIKIVLRKHNLRVHLDSSLQMMEQANEFVSPLV